MTPAALQRFFDTSPAVHLLRSPNAAWILDFLQQQFKCSGEITRTHSNLAAQLATYLTDVRHDWAAAGALAGNSDRPGEETVRLKTETYLARWCSGECGWLKRFIDEHQSEPVYQLTPDSEMVLAFVRKATSQSSAVGTRSHFRSILNLLREVVMVDVAATEKHEPQLQIEHLQRQRAEIDRQIEQLQTDAELDSQVPRLGDASHKRRLDVLLIQEQFSLAVAQLEQLKSEFRAVEERFKSITRGVQQRLSAESQSRGEIIQFALDAEDLLKVDEQGRSFFEFLKLVHDPTNQTQLAELVQELMHLDALAHKHDELQALRSMVPSLLAEAEKILRTTQHLSHTLRRLLDSRSTRHHQQLAQVLRDIRGQAVRLCESPPSEVSLEVEVELDIQLPFDRPFWSQSEPFADVDLQLAEDDPHEHALALEQLVALERIDWQTIRRNISRATQADQNVAIADLLKRFPIRIGIVELLGYLQIAHEDGHSIDATQTIELQTDWEGAHGRVLQLPQVVFRAQTQRQQGTGYAVGSAVEGAEAAGGSEGRATRRAAAMIDATAGGKSLTAEEQR